MKKTLAILMVVALAATAVFADVTIGAWGRGFAVPIASNGDDMKAGQTISWGAGWGGPIRTGFTIAGSADNVGFQVDMNADGFGAGIGDEAKIWVKPIDMLTLSVGKVQDNTLRGDAAFGMFNWLRAGAGGLGEDFTFTRLGNGAGSQVTGMTLAFAPIDALYINAAVPLDIAFGANDVAYAYKNAQVGLGYTIDGIGTIKAQFIGNYTNATVAKRAHTMTEIEYLLIKGAAGDFDAVDEYNAATDAEKADILKKASTDAVSAVDAHSSNSIEVAFDLKAVENLNASLAFKYNMAEDKYRKKATPLFRVALSGAYNMDALTINLLAALNSYSASKEAMGDNAFSGMRIDGGLGLGYALEALTVVGDVRLETYTGDFSFTGDKGATSIAFLVGLEKGLGNGVVGIGFQGATNGTALASLTAAKDDSFLFAVPIRFEYWF